jgi:two-component system, NtrC family, nitrogen regulation sensor histidine kinase NtrY
VDEFSAFARMPRPVYREEDLGQLVRQAVFLQQVARQDIRFESRLPATPLRLSCDARQIAQVMTNILQNAIDAIDGREKADGKILPPGRIAVTLEAFEGGAEIRVVDNGRGLPVENRDRLFEPYVTTRTKGTGLGLAIVKKIIEEHGGTIILTDAATVDPTSESGSLARIRLPSAPVAAVPPEMAAEPASDPARQDSDSGLQSSMRKSGSGSHGA